MRHPRKRPHRGGGLPGGSKAKRTKRIGLRTGSGVARAGAGAGVESESSPEGAAHPELGAFRKALIVWGDGGTDRVLVTALREALDKDGAPKTWPVAAWSEALEGLERARQRRGNDWPEAVHDRLEGLLRAVLRFSRPDGVAFFDAVAESPAARARVLRAWAQGLGDGRSRRVVDDWFLAAKSERKSKSAPPLPADARADRPLAVLRANWSRQGDWLAIDHRDPRGPCQLELAGLAQWWLGPTWMGVEGAGPLARPPRVKLWKTGPHADLAEWAFESAGGKVIRTALYLRGRQLALLADQVEGAGPSASMRLALAPGVKARPDPHIRAFRLTAGRASARVLPLALPALPYPTDRGSLALEDRSLVLRQNPKGKRDWLPLLVSWNPDRNRKPIRWRVLTVSERSTILGPDAAFAVRVAWGRESLIIYRNLVRPDQIGRAHV
jgi:hypothetical protein